MGIIPMTTDIMNYSEYFEFEHELSILKIKQINMSLEVFER